MGQIEWTKFQPSLEVECNVHGHLENVRPPRGMFTMYSTCYCTCHCEGDSFSVTAALTAFKHKLNLLKNAPCSSLFSNTLLGIIKRILERGFYLEF